MACAFSFNRTRHSFLSVPLIDSTGHDPLLQRRSTCRCSKVGWENMDLPSFSLLVFSALFAAFFASAFVSSTLGLVFFASAARLLFPTLGRLSGPIWQLFKPTCRLVGLESPGIRPVAYNTTKSTEYIEVYNDIYPPRHSYGMAYRH